MVICPKCKEDVNNALLRSEKPTCKNGHELGQWFACKNQGERHVFLSQEGTVCPYCKSQSESGVKEGTKVKCLHATAEGVICATPPFLWLKEGPPCFMNHVDKMRFE